MRQLADKPRLEKWAERLVEHYRKIPQMVPEWEDELALESAAALQSAAHSGAFEEVERQQRKLAQTCKSCHREYRAIAAAMYRSPDFSQQTVASSANAGQQSYSDAMAVLSRLVNGIVIAMDDGQEKFALQSLGKLETALADLGRSCGACHEDPAAEQRILGEDARKTLDGLQQAIRAGDRLQAGRMTGEAAVQVCARCHAVHRTLYDLSDLLK